MNFLNVDLRDLGTDLNVNLEANNKVNLVVNSDGFLAINNDTSSETHGQLDGEKNKWPCDVTKYALY